MKVTAASTLWKAYLFRGPFMVVDREAFTNVAALALRKSAVDKGCD
jgi:hypothetical protein